MTLLHAPSIVLNGLVLYMDAANSNSYPGSGTIWSDIIGNNDATLVNGVGYSSSNLGSLTFNGTTQYGSIPSVTGITDFTSSNNYTIDCWVYLNSTQNNTQSSDNDVIEKWDGFATRPYPYVIRYLRGTQQMVAGVFNGTTANNATIQISSNAWWHISSVFNWSSSLLTLYGNGGQVQNSGALNATGISNAVAINLMRRGNGINYATGQISNIKIYNRALSAAEVQQNFNAHRGRYGL